MALLARASRSGPVAVVDAADGFDPASARASGVELSRLLWVKCGGRLDAVFRAADLLARCSGFALVALDLSEVALTRRDLVPASLGLRLQRAVEGTTTILVLRGLERLAGSFATLVVSLHRIESRWIGLPRPTRLAGFTSEVRILRSRIASAPAARAESAWRIEWRL
jgi:hypothetical protein